MQRHRSICTLRPRERSSGILECQVDALGWGLVTAGSCLELAVCWTIHLGSKGSQNYSFKVHSEGID